ALEVAEPPARGCISRDREQRQNEAHRPLLERSEAHRAKEARVEPPPREIAGLSKPEAREGGSDQKRKRHVEDNQAGKSDHQRRRRPDESRSKRHSTAEHSPGQQPNEEDRRHGCERRRKARRPFRESPHPKRRGHQPEEQRWLVQVGKRAKGG